MDEETARQQALAHYRAKALESFGLPFNAADIVPDPPPRPYVPFKVGDLVTRMGDDVHLVIGEAEYGQGDNIRVLCIKAADWCAVGEIEDNLERRYTLVPKTLHDALA